MTTNEKKVLCKAVNKIWWLMPLMVVAVSMVVVQSQGGGGIGSWSNTSVEQTNEIVAKPGDPHKPVHIRLGVITDIGVDYIILETKKLVGQGKEKITALLAGDTTIIEIQIPSFMNTELRKKLDQAGDVIPRLEKSQNDLYIGQTVEVVSVSDMYGYSEVSATRVEYKVIMDTEEQI